MSQLFLQISHLTYIQASAVKAQRAVFLHAVSQPFGNRGHPLLHLAIEVDAGAGQFLFRLYEVAAVCPQTRLLHTDHKRSVGTGKTAEIMPGLKIRRHVLRIMIIRCRDQIIIDPQTPHLPTKLFKPFHNDCIYHTSAP